MTTMTTMTTDKPTASAVYECPSWCVLDESSHSWDTEVATGRAVRSHDGPTFGEGDYDLGGVGDEYADAPGALWVRLVLCDVPDGNLSAAEARALAAALVEAADWLDARTASTVGDGMAGATGQGTSCPSWCEDHETLRERDPRHPNYGEVLRPERHRTRPVSRGPLSVSVEGIVDPPELAEARSQYPRTFIRASSPPRLHGKSLDVCLGGLSLDEVRWVAGQLVAAAERIAEPEPGADVDPAPRWTVAGDFERNWLFDRGERTSISGDYDELTAHAELLNAAATA